MYNIKPSNSNAHDKKENNHNNNKLILASDDQKSLSKNNEENKRKIATNRLGNSGAVQNVAFGMSSSNVNNMMLNTNLNMGVTSNSTVIQKDKKNSLGPITKTEKNPLKISNNNLSNYTNIYNSNNKVESFGLTKINLNPSSKVNSTKRAKG